MNLIFLAERIENAGLGTLGVDIFLNHFPAQAKTGLMLKPSAEGALYDMAIAGLVKLNFSLIARSTNYDSSQALAEAACKAIAVPNNTQLGEFYVTSLRQISMPVGYPISVGEFVEHSAKFLLRAIV